MGDCKSVSKNNVNFFVSKVESKNNVKTESKVDSKDNVKLLSCHKLKGFVFKEERSQPSSQQGGCSRRKGKRWKGRKRRATENIAIDESVPSFVPDFTGPVPKEFEAQLASIDKDIDQINKGIDKLSSKKQKLLALKQQINEKLRQHTSEKLANQDWERTDHPWSQKVNETLQSVFKLNQFRPYQLSTINAVMSRHNCILLMPTGGGKSLCYQLPALVLPGITLVVSPLVSLMEDQIMAMEALNVPAVLLNASSTREHVNNIQRQMTENNSTIKLLYVTPEKLAKSKRFMSKLEKMYKMGKFSLLAIDEVHCCSQWGHDFRTDYKFLGIMKRQFPKVPILGLTATATSSVITDVQNILNIQGCLVLRASFNRPNLKYEVVCKSSSEKDNIDELENLLKNRFNGLTGIIYCFSIKNSEDIAAELRKRCIKARAYHAQLDPKARSSVHKSWSSGSIQVIVATIAFGMGIDKPDVRFVIHHSIPKSMENFYQESGRAGRDDNPASCVLFYRFPDIFRQSTMVFTEQKGLEHLYAMVSYCLDLSRCRRSIIAEHFGERWESSDCNSMCDHCDKFTPYVQKMTNMAKEYKTLCCILEHCNSIDERLTSQKLIDSWRGKAPPKLRPSNYKITCMSREKCERIVALLLLDSYLVEEFHFTPYSTISYINVGPRNLPSSGELLLPLPVLRSKLKSETPPAQDNKSSTNSVKNTASPEKRKQLSNDSETQKKIFKSKHLSTVVSNDKPSSSKSKPPFQKIEYIDESEDEFEQIKLSDNEFDFGAHPTQDHKPSANSVKNIASKKTFSPEKKKQKLSNENRTHVTEKFLKNFKPEHSSTPVSNDKPSTSKVKSESNEPKLCVVNKEKSHFHNMKLIESQDEPIKKEEKSPEPVQLSDNELEFDDNILDLYKKKKPVSIITVSDSE